MESGESVACPLHGAGVGPHRLAGRRLAGVVVSRHHGDAEVSGPLDVWLIDAEGDATQVTTGSDWCLIVADTAPHAGHDLGEWGRVEVAPADDETPFAAHLGETVLAVHEVSEPGTGRRRVDFTFESGDVRCEVHAGELRLSAH